MTEAILNFGRHRGESIRRVPVSYLKWMVGSADFDNQEMKAVAQAELDRRGTVTPTLEVSGHAIDRASLYARKTWHQERGPQEGLHGWLVNRATEALVSGLSAGDGRRWCRGLLFVFEMDGSWPVLKTVIVRDKPKPEWKAVDGTPK